MFGDQLLLVEDAEDAPIERLANNHGPSGMNMRDRVTVAAVGHQADPEVANSPDAAARNVIPMYELKWSHAEKRVARRAFDLALGKELETLLQEAKGRAARIEEPSELWDLESWLTERRREIDRRYDYRYSILPLVFAQLLRDGRLTEDDLHGLGQEKLDLIRRASAI
jgi:hypothetical protein